MNLFLTVLLFSILIFSVSAQKPAAGDELADRLTDAAGAGDLETIKKMLDKGIDINIYRTSHRGWTALMSAVTSGRTETVEFLLARGADAKVRLEKGETTLIQAAQSENNERIVEALIKAGAPIDAQTEKGLTALMRLAWMSQPEAVKLLLDAGADTRLKDKNGWTAFYFACSHGSSERTVKYLLEAGADPNERGPRGETPLMWTGWGERSENFKALIAAGADVNARADDGMTALMISSARFFQTEVDLLLAAGADVKARDKNGRNALMYASASTFRKEEFGAHGDGHIVWIKAYAIIEKLISAGADPNAQDDRGETALMLAVKAGNAHFVHTLLARGATAALKNKKGRIAADFIDEAPKYERAELKKAFAAAK